jgi:hypothetical protein
LFFCHRSVLVARLRPGASVKDETKIALIASDRLDAGGNAVEPIDTGEQRRLRI